MGHYSVRGCISLDCCSQVCPYAPVAPAAYKVEAGGLLDPGRSVRDWATQEKKQIKVKNKNVFSQQSPATEELGADHSCGADEGTLPEPI